jgi:hypothetical protein
VLPQLLHLVLLPHLVVLLLLLLVLLPHLVLVPPIKFYTHINKIQ